jgi:hypothetical protein
MSNADFRNINNAALKGLDPTQPSAVYTPLVTLQNRIDVAEFTTGDPQFFGGNKLTARYYLNEVVNNEATTYDTIVNQGDAQTFLNDDGDLVTSETFWENGQFTFFSDLHPSLDDGLGCIEWTGYFRPSVSGRYFFRIDSTGLYSFEFNAHSDEVIPTAGSFTAKKVVPLLESVSGTFTDGSDTIVISNETQYGESVIDQIAEGDIVSGSFAPLDDPENNPVTVTNVNYSTRQVTISETLSSPPSTGSVDIISQFGQNKRLGYTTSILERYQAYPIRIKFLWIDGFGEQYNPTDAQTKQFNVFIDSPLDTLSEFNYKFLYSEDYNNLPEIGSEGAGDFYKFFVERVPPGGTRLILNNDGSIGADTGFSGYRNLLSRDTVNLPYEPPQTYSDAVFSKSLDFSVGGITLSTSNTDGITVGNLLLGDNVDRGTIVSDVIQNQAVSLNQPINSGSSPQTFYFADHQGLKGYVGGVSSDTTTYPDKILGVDKTLSDQFSVGDIVVAPGATSTSGAWARITDISDSQTDPSNFFWITLSKNLDSDIPSSPQDFFLVYYSSSLEDRSLDTFCSDAVAAETTAFASAGASTLQVDTTAARTFMGGSGVISVGDYVYYGDRIPDSTTIVSKTDTEIELSNPINQEIPAEQTLAFSSVDEDKGVCFRPRDTSPPFIATEEGLRTTSTYPNMVVGSTNGELRFGNLYLGNSADVSGATGSEVSDYQIPIKDIDGNEFKILTVKSQ